MIKNFKKFLSVFVVWGLFSLSFSNIYATFPWLELVSINNSEQQGNARSLSPVISANGRYVAFFSEATNLVPGDTNATTDIFVHDRIDGTTERVSVGDSNQQANGGSSISPSISADGRYVAFVSNASNLVLNDTNGQSDAFVRDRLLGKTIRISVSSSGEQGNQTVGTSRAKISEDGNYVAFESNATNLVSDDTNNWLDVFVYNMSTGTTERVSMGSGEIQAEGGISHNPSISGDGSRIVFESNATNLVSDDTNNWTDIFVRDMLTQSTERVSVDNQNNQVNYPSGAGASVISNDGKYVAFISWSDDLVTNDTNGLRDVFLRDLALGTTTLVSVSNFAGVQSNGFPYNLALSADNRYILYDSEASNLVSSDTDTLRDVYGYDRLTGKTTLLSKRLDGVKGNRSSVLGSFYGEGMEAVFASYSGNLSQDFIRSQGAGIFIAPYPLNQSPTANAGLDQIADEGSEILLDGSLSADSDGVTDIVSYEWDFGDGNVGNGRTVNHTYLDDGIYTAILTVTDTAGEFDTNTAVITVNNVAPTADFSVSPTTIIQGESAILSFVNPFDPSPVDTAYGFTYSFDCTNDGIFELLDSSTTTSVCTYPDSGVYVARGEIKDKDGGHSYYTIAITVQTPSEAIIDLVDLVTSIDLQDGINNSLDAKLDSALSALNDINLNNDIAAINSLHAFINAVEAQRDVKITSAQADILIAAAQAIINSL